MTNPTLQLPYFAPLLPWQARAWGQATTQFYADKLPHGLLASGMAGIGKREFVWRFVAWLLCHDKGEQGACGVCQSCTWLMAGTHPDLLVLPSDSLPTNENSEQSSIKIDDVRALQEYSHTKGRGVRLVVLDHADRLTLGAGNALLKTLEEPRSGVHLLLISDNPTKLLPTIKSRVQALPLGLVDYDVALRFVVDNFVANDTGNDGQHEKLARLALNLADGAVLRAIDLPNQAWFDKRVLWLKTWLALKTGIRPPITASDYWQGVLDFDDFVILTRLMLADVVRVSLGLDSLHTDIDVKGVVNQPLSLDKVEAFLASLDDMAVSVAQNVQEKMAYDELFYRLGEL